MRKKYSAKLIDRMNNARNNLVELKSSDNYRKDYKELDKSGLNPTQRAILVYVYDNMKQSVQRKGFYDKKRHNYYAIVTRKTVSSIYNISEDTVSNTLDQLQVIGYIQKVQSWNSGVKVFVRHFICDSSETGKSPNSRTEETVPNKNELIKNHLTDDTEHTSSSSLNADDKIKKIVLDTVKQLKVNQTSQAVQDNTIDDNKDDKHLNYAVLGTKAMPEKANKSINIIANSLHPNDTKKRSKFIHDVNGMIFKFKSAIFKKHDLYKQSRWENNETLTNQFNHSIYEMLYNAFSGQRDVDSSYAYFGGSLRKLFTKIVDQLLGKHTGSKQSHSKQKKTSVKGNHRIKEKVPYWAKDGYTPDCHKLSSDKKQEIQARLKRLDAKLG